jgi:hypothetical protein
VSLQTIKGIQMVETRLPGDDFGEVPGEDELTKRWRLVEKDFGEGVGGPSGLGNLAPVQKWQIICVYDQQEARRRAAAEGAADQGEEGGGGMFASMLADDDDLQHFLLTPARWLDRLRDQHAGQLPLSVAGDLKLQLKAASVSCARLFHCTICFFYNPCFVIALLICCSS